MVKIDQHHGQQQAGQEPTSCHEPPVDRAAPEPGEGCRPGARTTRDWRNERSPHGWSGQEHGHPEAGAQQLHGRVAGANRSAAVAASAPQHQPAQHGDGLEPGQAGAAVGAVAGGQHHRFLARQSPGHHIEEAAHAGAHQGNTDGQEGETRARGAQAGGIWERCPRGG